MEEHEVLHIISRKKAKELNMDWYFTGKPCKWGHVVKRRTSSGCCLICQRNIDSSPEVIERKRKWREERPDYFKNWRKENPEYGTKYREENKDHIRDTYKVWSDNNRELKREVDKTHYQNNKEKRKANKKMWSVKNPDYNSEYTKRRSEKDPYFKASLVLRDQVRRMTKLSRKGRTSDHINSLGYSLNEYRKNIESKMLPGMCWANMSGVWHIDHITPVAKYTENGVFEPSVINSLDNLAPMWAEHNLSKGSKTLEEWLSEKGEDSEEYKLYGHYLNKE